MKIWHLDNCVCLLLRDRLIYTENKRKEKAENP